MLIKFSRTRKCAFIVAAIAMCIPCGNSNAGCQRTLIFESPCTKTRQTSTQAFSATVNDFLTCWLIRKSESDAMDFFGSSAFANVAMLGESCASYIAPKARHDPTAVRTGIKAFLSEFEKHVNGTDSNTVLVPLNVSHRPLYNRYLVNDSARDRFLVLNCVKEVLDELVEKKEYRDHLIDEFSTSEAYVVVVGVNLQEDREKFPGYFYFLWAREGGEWKIVHAGMICQ